MKVFTATSLALSLKLASAQVAQCDGNRRPNWDDCLALVEDFGMKDNPEIAHTNGELDPAPSCMNWWWTDGNCLISHCYEDDSTNPDGTPQSLTLGQVWELWDPIRSKCRAISGLGTSAGGYFQGAFEFVSCYNDPNNGGGSGDGEETSAEKIKLFDALPNAQRIGANGVKGAQISLEQYREMMNDTAPAAAETPIPTPTPEVEAAIQKRQNENDDYFEIIFSFLGTRREGDFERATRLAGKGQTYKWESSTTTTRSVVTTVEMGGSWAAFSASIGVEIGETEAFTFTESLELKNTCDGDAQVTFWPLYDFYQIRSWPSETYIEVFVPVVNADRKINGEIAMDCIG